MSGGVADPGFTNNLGFYCLTLYVRLPALHNLERDCVGSGVSDILNVDCARPGSGVDLCQDAGDAPFRKVDALAPSNNGLFGALRHAGRYFSRYLGCVLLAACLAMSVQTQLVFMSYNLRYATAADGANAWPLRSGLVYDVINRRSPDVLGVQEALASQVDELLAHLKGYSFVGVGRDDGRRAGEFSAVFYKRDKFSVVDSGTYWMSDTPEIPGSKSWGNNVVRICTWVKLRSRDGFEFTVSNVHLDHEPAPSRLKSVELVCSRFGDGVLMGDFNAGESSPEVAHVKGKGWVDTFRVLHSGETEVGTFNGFAPTSTKGDKIDYVFVSPGWRVVESGIDRTVFDGRCPSDHFPVWAVVEKTT